MKVTKAIRDYIEEQIYAKANNCAQIVKLKEDEDKAISEFSKDRDAFNEMVTKELKKIAEKHSIKFDGGRRYNYCSLAEHDLPTAENYRKAKQEINYKARKAVTEIIATMELGGTKAELLEMINNLEF